MYGTATGMVQGLKGGRGSGYGTAMGVVQGLKGGGLSPIPKFNHNCSLLIYMCNGPNRPFLS